MMMNCPSLKCGTRKSEWGMIRLPHAKLRLLVKVNDYLTWGEELEIPVDLVVLAVGMMPNPIEDIINC